MSVDERVRTELSAAAAGVEYAAKIPLELAARVRRRRTVRLGAVTTASAVAVVVMATAALPLLSVGDNDQARRDPAAASSQAHKVTVVPSAPLAARAHAAAVWTGREVVVWGGSRGTQSSSHTFDDGASFDRAAGAWRRLPKSPLSGRVGAVAVWSGREVLVWGGNTSSPGPVLPRDGALFNPVTRTWRRIADAPAGRTFARGFFVRGTFVVAGGDTPTGSATSTLVYDPATDRWREIASSPYVVDAGATASEVVTVSVEPATRQLSAAAIDPVRAVTRPLPPLPGWDRRPQRIGIATSGDEVVVAVMFDGATRVATLAPSRRDWTLLGRETEFRPPVAIGFSADTSPLVLTNRRLLSSSEFGVEMLELGTGAVTSLHQGGGATSCGAGAADAWLGDAMFSWGGQSCRANTSAVVATGVIVRP